jgi:NitT/TauT family transport system substrate-binding protein
MELLYVMKKEGYPMKRWMALIALALAFVIIVTTGCSSSQEPSTVKIAEVTRSLFYAPEYVAISKGFFEEEGLNVELNTVFGGDKTMTALLSGEADVALVGTETSIYVYSQGASDPVINFAQLTQTDGTFLVARKPIENFKWDMLKGKVLLGQRKGGMPEMVSEYVQHLNGIEPFKDVEIIQNVEFQNLGPAFASGTGDFVQLFEPVASKLEQEGVGHVVASFGDQGLKLPYTVFMSRKSFIDTHPETVQKFTNAIYKAQQWVDSHSAEEVADAVAGFFEGIDRDIMVSSIDRYKKQGSFATDPIVDEEEYNNLEKVMEYSGELKKRVPYEAIINTTFAENAIGK